MKKIVCKFVLALLIFHSGHLFGSSEWDEMVKNNVRSYSNNRGDRFSYRGGIGPSGSAAYSSAKKIDWFKVKGNFKTKGNNCGGLDFGAQFKAMFNKEALNEYLGDMKNLVTGLVASAPMLILETVDPQLADVLKHLKAMTNINMSTKVGQCKDLYKAMSKVGREMFQTQKAKCYERKLAGGSDTEKAMADCADYNQLPDFFGKIHGPDEPVNLTEEAIRYFGMDTSGNSGVANAFRSIMGSTTLTAQGGVAYKEFEKAKDKAREKRKAYESSFAKGFNRIVENFKKSGRFSRTDMKLIQGSVTYSEEFLFKLATSSEDIREIYIKQLSKALADDRMAYEKDEEYKQALEKSRAVRKDPAIQAAEASGTKFGPVTGVGAGLPELDPIMEDTKDNENIQKQSMKVRKVINQIMSMIEEEESIALSSSAKSIVKNNKATESVPSQYGTTASFSREVQIENAGYSESNAYSKGGF
jgi:hypothetical protein